MPSARRNGRVAAGSAAPPFVLYVEGPRDRDVLEGWARRLAPPLARALAEVAVILGGCRPARAIEHFRVLRQRGAAERALCVLDSDGGSAESPAHGEPGLDFFTWRRRHIESYLLVPQAIRRSLRLSSQDVRIERFFRTSMPDLADEEALAQLDAKRVFARHGPLARALGSAVGVGRVARAMRADEMHRDVRELLDRLGRELGVRPRPEAVVRRT